MKARHCLLASLITACASAEGGQTGSEHATDECAVVTSETLDPSQDSGLGFAGNDVLSLTLGRHETTLTWADGTSTDAVVEVTYDGGAIRVEREWRASDSGEDLVPESTCLDQVTVEADVALRTCDGAFDEQWPAVLVMETEGRAEVRQELDPAKLEGSYVVHERDAEACEAVRLRVALTFDATGVGGGEHRRFGNPKVRQPAGGLGGELQLRRGDDSERVRPLICGRREPENELEILENRVRGDGGRRRRGLRK